MAEGKIEENGSYHNGITLILGGLGGLGMAFAKLEAQREKSVIVLSGRREITEEGNAFLGSIKNGNVVYKQVDITDRNDMARMIDSILKEYGHIRRIIHSAGVIKDSLILNKSFREMKAVLEPKIRGLYILDELTLNQPIDTFVVFSSISSAIGNVGQADYAFANGFMNGFVKHRNRLTLEGKRSGKAISISWPLWKDTGMQIPEESLAVMKNETGLDALQLEQGLQAYLDVLDYGWDNPIVVSGNDNKIWDYFCRQYGDTNRSDKIEGVLNEDPKSYEVLEHSMKHIISEITKVPTVRIENDEEFEAYGVDSIMLMEMENRLNKQIDGSSQNVFLKCNTIDKAVKFLLKNQIGLKKVGEKTVKEKQNHFPGTEKNLLPKEILKVPQIKDRKESEVAIVGMACKFPAAKTVEEFWDNLKEGKNCISRSKELGYYGGYIEDKDKFDPLFFHIAPNQAKYLDPQERLMLETVWHALEDGGYSKESLIDLKQKGQRTGVFIGAMYEHYPNLAADVVEKAILTGNSYWSIANRISYFLDLNGPSMAVDTACSSSLSAIHLAFQSIQNEECDLAIVGGVNLSLDIGKFIGLDHSQMLETGQMSMSFQEGKGYLPGEGVGAILLRRVEDSVLQRNRIYCTIGSTFMNHSGKSKAYKVPSEKAQIELIQGILERSNLNMGDISYYESAANGSVVGDAIEINGLIQAFSASDDTKEGCVIGCVKSNLGHLEAASGISQLIKTALMLYYKKLLPSIKMERPNPNINLAGSPFRFHYEYSDWNHSGDGKRNALITSIGAGGTNVCTLLSEYDSGESHEKFVMDEEKLFIIPFSAMTMDSLVKMLVQIIDFIDRNPNCPLADLAFSMYKREVFKERIAITAKNSTELLKYLKQYIYEDSTENANLITKELTEQGNLTGTERERAFGWVMGKSKLKEADYSEGKLITLPNYVFEDNRYWIDMEPKKPADVSNIFHGSEAMEEQVIHILSRLLEVPAKRIDAKQPLDQYGMDSIVGIKLINLLNEQYGSELKASTLYENYTVSSLCDRISENRSEVSLPYKHDAIFYLDNFLLSAIEENKNTEEAFRLREDILQWLNKGR